jgi:hypothetical protein
MVVVGLLRLTSANNSCHFFIYFCECAGVQKKDGSCQDGIIESLAAYRASVVSNEENNGPGNNESVTMFQHGKKKPAAQQQQHHYPSNFNMPPQQKQQPQYAATMAVMSAPMPQQPAPPMSKKPSPLLNTLTVDQEQQQIQHQQDQQQQQQNMMNYLMQNNRPADMNQQPQMMTTGLAPNHVQQTDMNYSLQIMQQLPPQQQQQQQSQSQQQPQQYLNQVTTTDKTIPGTNVHPHYIVKRVKRRKTTPILMQPSPLLNSLMVDQQQQLHLHQQQQQQIQHQQDQQQQQQNMMNYPMQNNRPADMNQQPQMMPTGLAPNHVHQTDMNYSPHIMQQQQQI